MSEKIILTANTSWYLYNFRSSHMLRLKKLGYEVVLVSPRDSYSGNFRELGIRWIELPLRRSSRNPCRELLTILFLCKVYFEERPFLVHHFTSKCVFYGTVAAKLTKVPAIVNSVTGLGHVFISKSRVDRLLRALAGLLYKLSLSGPNTRILVQNQSDLLELARIAQIDPNRTRIVRGSGIDTQRFFPRRTDRTSRMPHQVLFVGRILRSKGVDEFLEAARVFKSRGSSVVFKLAGGLDPANPASIDSSELEALKRENVAEFLGHVDRVESAIAESSIVVLPSYREGMPRGVLEASAMGKPAITTDVPGCREAVVDGVTGLIVPKQDTAALVEAIDKLLADPDLRSSMGQAGVERVKAEFSDERIIRETLEVYSDLGLPRVQSV